MMSFTIMFNDGTYVVMSLEEAMKECPYELGIYLEKRMLE